MCIFSCFSYPTNSAEAPLITSGKPFKQIEPALLLFTRFLALCTSGGSASVSRSSLTFIPAKNFANENDNASIDVVFVHGLNGDPIKTWSASEDPKDFWPQWLAEEFPRINVWSFGYDSSVIAGVLSGEGASIIDYASILKDFILSNGLGVRPILFIAHSLGGLIVKQMLRKCSDSIDPKCKPLLASAGGIIFLGTPHCGSSLATSISNIVGPILSKQVKQLSLDSESLHDLNNWFKNWAVSKRVYVASYYETKKTNKLHVVPVTTADPGISGCDPIAIEADHYDICKPDSHEAQLYSSVTALLKGSLEAMPSTIKLNLPAATSSLPIALPTPGKPVALLGSNPLVPTDSALDFDTSVFVKNSAGTQIGSETLPTKIGLGAPAATVATKNPAALPPELLTDYEFFTTTAPHDRRPLAQKLEDGGRLKQIDAAKQSKERFAKALQRHSAQVASLGRYTRLMSEVETRFKWQVMPAINEGATEKEINLLVQQAVIEPVLKQQMNETDDVTASVVESALFYLTGNCHVRWDADKT